MSDDARERCGLFGIFGVPDAVENTFLGLYALQHRGEEGCGVASSDGKHIIYHRQMGLVSEVFSPELIEKLRNPHAIGHNRYSTTGSSISVNLQPLVVSTAKGEMAVAHNGNIVNAAQLRRECESRGSIFQTTMDSEVVVHLMARPGRGDLIESLVDALRELKGAFSLVLLVPNAVIGVRDRLGFRPLCVGEKDGTYVLASETCALDQIGANYLREVEPGEVVVISDDGLKSRRFCDEGEVRPHRCIFELLYFARPDSLVFGQNVHLVRKRFGVKLAEEHPADADVVIPVPDGGNSAALGYAERSGIPFDFGFIRNHYVGRTFILASQTSRDTKVRVKLNPVAEVVRGKRLVVVDDSIVRGTTSKAKIGQLRQAGAKEIHMRITSPPHRFPCYYGIDFQARQELIAAGRSEEEIAKFLGLDSLGYLGVDGLLDCVQPPRDSYCLACFTGDYAEEPPEHLHKLVMEEK